MMVRLGSDVSLSILKRSNIKPKNTISKDKGTKLIIDCSPFISASIKYLGYFAGYCTFVYHGYVKG